MRMRVFTFKILFICLSVSLLSCNNEESRNDTETEIFPADEKKDELAEDDRPMSRSYLLARMRENDELSSFTEQFEKSGLEEEFEGEESIYTIFAPSNAAYDRIPARPIKEHDSVEVQRKMHDQMKYYMVEGEMTLDYLKSKIAASENNRYEFETALGEKLWASEKDGKIILTDVLGNQAAIVTSNLDEYYGVYHVLDNVLQPGDD